MDTQHKILNLIQGEWQQLSSAQIFGPHTRNFRVSSAPFPINAKALQAIYGCHDILPIEYFKLHASALSALLTSPEIRHFYSSGTTSSQPSISPFSKMGLEIYRCFSLKTFQAILSHFFSDPKQVTGISLIPTTTTWPHSSLAQMLTWISEEYQVQFLNEGDALQAQSTVWLFTTAFHLVNLADKGVKIKLPPQSIVIETGGTKGQSRSVTREELYDLIESTLGIPRNRIVSEYGMCELASQAYDFVDAPNGPEQKLSHRWYRYPIWSEVRVFDRLSHEQQTGEGTLLISDHLRIDFPWPIRTEDMAFIRYDGAFQLLGRVPSAPLKGCSMLAEQIIGQGTLPKPKPTLDSTIKPQLKLDLNRRASLIHERVLAIINDPEWIYCWLQEFKSAQVVTWLRQDLSKSIPSTPDKWQLAAQQVLEQESPQRWLVIPPSSHSLACLEPIILGMIAGLELTVRADPGHKMIKLLQILLEPIGCLSIWSLKNRIGSDSMPAVDALMVYGSNETLAVINAKTSVALQGFGTYLAASIVDRSLLRQTAQAILKDSFSLMQRGCRASRLLFVLNCTMNEELTLLSDELLALSANPVGPLTLGQELAIEHGSLKARTQSQSVRTRKQHGEPLITGHNFKADLSLAKLIDLPALSLCIITITKLQIELFSDWLHKQPDLKQLALGPCERKMLNLGNHWQLVCPGLANAQVWNGLHEGRPLFSRSLVDVSC